MDTIVYIAPYQQGAKQMPMTKNNISQNLTKADAALAVIESLEAEGLTAVQRKLVAEARACIDAAYEQIPQLRSDILQALKRLS